MSLKKSLLAAALVVAGCVEASEPPTSAGPKGYIVAEVTVTNASAYEGYRQAVSPVVARHGGVYLVRGGRSEVLEGRPAGRVVVLEFPSVAAARAFYESPEYQAIVGQRKANATSRVVLVEGFAP
jgi:uncharacterized protein (DUF1330 family)